MDDQDRSGLPFVFKLAGIVLGGVELLFGSMEIAVTIALAAGGVALLACSI